VSFEPAIHVETLNSHYRYLILACDGLWDVMSHQDAAELCHQGFKAGLSPHDVAKTLVETALKNRTEDNVTVIIANIKWNNPSEPEKEHVHSKETAEKEPEKQTAHTDQSNEANVAPNQKKKKIKNTLTSMHQKKTRATRILRLMSMTNLLRTTRKPKILRNFNDFVGVSR